MKNEMDRLISKYNMEKAFIVTTYGDKSFLNLISKLLANFQSYDNPDIFSILDNKVMILEHFEFDCTKNNKTGSEYRKERARINRNFDKMPPNDTGDALFHDEIICDESLSNYFENLKLQFRRHYSRIPDYKTNLSTELQLSKEVEFITGFFIEDVSALGTSYKDANGYPEPLRLVLCKQFLDMFEKCADLDFVISGCYFAREHHLFFVSKDSINSCREFEVDLSKVEIFKWNPVVSGYNFSIPDDN